MWKIVPATCCISVLLHIKVDRGELITWADHYDYIQAGNKGLFFWSLQKDCLKVRNTGEIKGNNLLIRNNWWKFNRGPKPLDPTVKATPLWLSCKVKVRNTMQSTIHEIVSRYQILSVRFFWGKKKKLKEIALGKDPWWPY